MKSLFVPKMFLDFNLFAPDGSLARSWREIAHSWVRNGYNYFFAACSDCPGDGDGVFGAGQMSTKNTSGTIFSDVAKCQDRETVAVSGTSGMTNSAASSAFGLIVGSGDDAFDVEQYNLAAQIAHGSGAGQLSHGVQAAPVLSYADYVWTASHVRTFSNLSGAQVTVKEVGFLRKQSIFSTSSYFLMSRDVLQAAVDIDPLAVLQLTLGISHDFSAIDGGA